MQTWTARFITELQLLGPAPFDTVTEALANSQQWLMITKLMPLLDYCDYLAREVAISSNEADIRRAHDATLLHLLCIGIDAWANEDSLPLDKWLITTKEKNKPDQRNEILLETIKSLKEITDKEPKRVLDEMLAGLKRLIDTHRDVYGLTKGFNKFFLNLPAPAAECLTENYVVGKKMSNQRLEVIEAEWKSLKVEEQLRLIADYLWTCRRNWFTHNSILYPEVQLGFYREFIEGRPVKRAADGSLKLEAGWIITSKLPENILVRSALAASVRQSALNDVTSTAFRYYVGWLINRYCGVDAKKYINQLHGLVE